MRHNLLLKLLSNEEHRNLLVNDYEELFSDCDENTPTTRATVRGVLSTIYAKTSATAIAFFVKL